MNLTTPKIADNSITLSKPAESFMKRVTLFDTAGGQALGWNPDGFTTTFTIIDTDVTSFLTAFIGVEIANGNDINYFCDTVDQDPGQFQIECSSAPANPKTLHYLLVNLPANLIQ
jgi:hypothetical protein